MYDGYIVVNNGAGEHVKNEKKYGVFSMIYSTNQKPVKLWKKLSLEVADSGFAKADTSWNMKNVCSPYSRIYYIPEGEGTVILQGREFPLRKGHIYLIPAGLLYDYRCDEYMEQLYFHVNITMPNGMDLFYGCGEIFEKGAPFGRQEKAVKLYWSSHMEDSFRLRGMLWEELGDFIKMAGIQEEGMKCYSEMVDQVFALARNPVSARNHVRSLAASLHVSESTLSKRFRGETGMTPGIYLEQLMIQKACRLLIHSDKTIAQIAEELEFSDQFYFAKFFKRLMHMPPSAYRRQMRENERDRMENRHGTDNF